jgi:hypothetical protein
MGWDNGMNFYPLSQFSCVFLLQFVDLFQEIIGIVFAFVLM